MITRFLQHLPHFRHSNFITPASGFTDQFSPPVYEVEDQKHSRGEEAEGEEQPKPGDQEQIP